MKWSKPQIFNRRFGFEITMYVYIVSEQRQDISISTSKLKAVHLIQSDYKEKEHETA